MGVSASKLARSSEPCSGEIASPELEPPPLVSYSIVSFRTSTRSPSGSNVCDSTSIFILQLQTLKIRRDFANFMASPTPRQAFETRLRLQNRTCGEVIRQLRIG